MVAKEMLDSQCAGKLQVFQRAFSNTRFFLIYKHIGYSKQYLLFIYATNYFNLRTQYQESFVINRKMTTKLIATRITVNFITIDFLTFI